MKKIILRELSESAEVLNNLINSDETIQNIEQAAEIMRRSIHSGNKIISCGNGGSMSDAMHFAEELTGRFRNDRKPLPAIAVSDPSYISCTANDYGYEQVFSRFVEALGKPGDCLLCISTSGNSENIFRAAKTASEKGVKVIALTGNEGGKLKDLADVSVVVPHSGYADRIQEMHIKIIHVWILLLEE